MRSVFPRRVRLDLYCLHFAVGPVEPTVCKSRVGLPPACMAHLSAVGPTGDARWTSAPPPTVYTLLWDLALLVSVTSTGLTCDCVFPAHGSH